ncbi:hypothetical protein Pint_16766 [Pistacia integerrima]|uniref:Uncharacterized protein n=1 Tax=Pistacia integerrima TaxID=434235 RepID=A0ACC0ZBS2_9ROSI|nr:hypothetical protein Pint_16766 [Pistacia integerrima]
MEEEQELIAQQAGLSISSVEKGSFCMCSWFRWPGLLIHKTLWRRSSVTLSHLPGDAKAGSVCEGDQSSAASVCGLAPGTWEWIGGKTSSTIAEWSLICDRKFLPAIPASLFFLRLSFGICFFWPLGGQTPGKKENSSSLVSFNLCYFISYFPLTKHLDLRFASLFKRLCSCWNRNLLPGSLHRSRWPQMARPSWGSTASSSSRQAFFRFL